MNDTVLKVACYLSKLRCRLVKIGKFKPRYLKIRIL